MKIGIIGAGGWGTALSLVLNENLHEICIWANEKYVVEEINQRHTNSIFLAGINIPEKIYATNNINELNDSEIYVFAVPTQYLRQIDDLKYLIVSGKIIVNVAKGIERITLMRISEILRDILGISSEQYTVLTGPSHAEEVVRSASTTVVTASENHNNEKIIQEVFSTNTFRVYSTDDVVGCELGGALKNVIAIAAGIIDGLKLGDNTKAALITRGLAEISRLGVSLGSNPLTFQGLSGLGDLFVTCNSKHSRNRSVGEQIGQGKKLQQIINETQMVAEGINTTESAYFLGKKHNVEMPITEQMYKILFENYHPLEAIRDLMTRESKRELWW